MKKTNGVLALRPSSCVCDSYRYFSCKDCATCTLCDDEYYMVTDQVWESAKLPHNKGMLCLGCLELRIGRLLTKDDFSDVPLNNLNFWPKSKRFTTRLTT